jgi:hypothetical protein
MARLAIEKHKLCEAWIAFSSSTTRRFSCDRLVSQAPIIVPNAAVTIVLTGLGVLCQVSTIVDHADMMAHIIQDNKLL